MPVQLNALCQIPRLYLAWNTVKAKGSVGGIDGISILEFEKEKRKEIPKLAEELKVGAWKPQPYMEIEVSKTKNPEEMRKLGMTAIRDKIVQHAIKSIIEPRYEKIFLGNSYGYDMIEIFRSQVVDRVVISLVQKGQNIEVRNGLLTDHTRQLLVKSVMERLARYEKYQGEEMKMEQIILRQANLLAKAFEGTEKFKPYVAKW